MNVKTLYAKQFRNISDEQIEFENGINVLYGKNASGKTNALEAIYLFASGKSLRGAAEKDFIQKDTDKARISIDYSTEKSPDRTKNMTMTFLKGNRRLMKYCGADVAKMSEFLGFFRSCVFTPDDLLLVKGSPEERRRFIDISISQISPRFVYCLNSYMRLLSQRNILLKTANIGKGLDKDYLFVINEQLSNLASVIVRQRAGFCENIYEYASKIYSDISSESELFGMKYISQTRKNYSDEKFTKNAFLELYEKNLEAEIKNGITLTGPHRDDLYFYVGKKDEILDEEEKYQNSPESIFDRYTTARAFGSRGQQRSVVLSLKLAQGELFYNKCGEYPVFLLDDVFSELDERRRNYILSQNKGKQIIITCCDCDVLGTFRDYNKIHVQNGQFS